MNKQFTHSVVSNEKLIPIFSLGELYVSSFLKPDESPKYPPTKLELAFDPVSKIVQLTEQPPAEAMWGSQYWYLSSVNPLMVAALKDVAEKTINCISKSDKKEVYVDAGCNDGTLLSFVDRDKFYTVGIDPSDYPDAPKNMNSFVRDFFSKEAFYKSGFKKCRYFSMNAVFYDLEFPELVLKDIYEILEDDGVATLQLSYTPLMIQQLEFSNLVHEHLTYYNLTSLTYLFSRVGFIVKDLELNNVNGGSIRVYLQKASAQNFKTPADKDICEIRVKSLLEWEENNGFNSIEKYNEFFEKILKLREETVNFIKNAKSQGKSVWALPASTKGNTLLGFFGLDNTLIDGIAEKQERKHGLRTICGDIPIFSEKQFREAAPDYCLILSWAFGESFKESEKEYLNNGGQFIFPAPEFYLYPSKNY